MTKYQSVYRTILLSALMICAGIANEAAATTPAYTVVDLGTLGGTSSAGYGINGSGQVAGNSSTTGGAAAHAFLWTPTKPNGASGAMVDLGTLDGTYSTGSSINASGQVVGWAYTNGAFLTTHAFLYDGTTHDLGTLGGTLSQGNGINSSGRVTGSSYMTGNADTHAFLYDGAMHDLGTLGGAIAEGLGINAGSQVTGYSYTTGDIVSHAFLYTSGAGMVDLNSLIDPLSGWELSSAPGINDAGQIVGYGTLGGNTHAFLLNPVPEPATATLFLMGCATAGAMRRRATSLHIAPQDIGEAVNSLAFLTSPTNLASFQSTKG